MDAREESTNSTGPNTEPATERDLATVAQQIGRHPRAMVGVACRCPFGHVAITAQAPVDDEGRPFPTAYYATCPHLVRQIDRLEGAGGVRRFEAALATDPVLVTQTQAAHQLHYSLHGAFISGARDTEHLKCLHAHAAFALAGAHHPLGQEVLREASPLWCDDNACSRVVE